MSIDIQLFYLPLHTNNPLILNKQMKLRNVSAGIVLCLTMVSCIQDEALNVEAAKTDAAVLTSNYPLLILVVKQLLFMYLSLQTYLH